MELATDFQQDLLADGFTTASASVDTETDIKGWQIALLAAWSENQCRPYLGVKHSDLEADTDVDLRGQVDGVAFSGGFDVQFEADDNVGVFAGTDFVVNQDLSWNIEGRFIDETAFTVGLNWDF